MRNRLVIDVHRIRLTLMWLLTITMASSLLLCAPGAVADERLDQELVKEVAQGNVAAVKALLDRGADPNAKEKDDPGAPALMIAAFKGNMTVVSELVRRGADVNSRDKHGSTPLMTACFNGHEDIVRLLLERGADPNIENELGRTAGIIAYRRGYSEIADLLGVREKMRAIVVLASIKLVIIAIILAWIAMKNMGRPLEKSFFHNQKWTLSDAYKMLIPLLALNYAHFVLGDPVRMHPTQLLMLDLLPCVVIYGLYWQFMKKRHSVTWSTFGLDNTSFKKSGLIHFNVASILVLSVFGIPRAFGWSHSQAQVPVSLGLDAILSVSALILIWPIAEELLLRGVLYAPFARRVGSRAAIGLLTVVTALAHLHHTWETLAVDAVGFFLLYCVYVRSLSLFGPIIWHITWNLVVCLVCRPSFYVLEPYLLLGLLAILIVVDSVWLLGRSRDNTRSNTETRFRA